MVALNSKYIHSSLALFYLRHELVRHCAGVSVEIVQATINDNAYETLLACTDREPDVIFVSANIWNSNLVEQLVRDIAESLPQAAVVVGGPQAGVVRQNLDEGLCSVVLGEIEAVPPQFYADLAAGTLGPLYTGSFLGQRIGQLDYPFLDEDFVSHLASRHIYYESSRGCPHSCSYCLSAAESGLFHKGLDQVKAELRAILRHRPRVVRFVDRTFNDLPKRAMAIWEFLLEEDGDTLFHFEIAPERFGPEMFALLEKVPCGRFQFEIGIQSTHPPTLRAINRAVNSTEVHEVVSRLAALNTIHLHVDLILGLPRDTPETFGRSFAELFAMGAHYIQMGLLKILPGTPIAGQARELGYRWSASPPYAVFANRWLSHCEMSRMYRFCECVEKFYNNRYFVSLWAYLRQSGEDVAAFFHALLDCGLSRGLFERAPTQEYLTSLLVALCASRSDARAIVELLRYDWLRCGFRNLPESLDFSAAEEDLAATRDFLYRRLPDAVDGIYASRDKNGFFRRSVFLYISAAGCRALAIRHGGEGVRLAFLGEREESPFRHNRVQVFDLQDKER